MGERRENKNETVIEKDWHLKEKFYKNFYFYKKIVKTPLWKIFLEASAKKFMLKIYV